MFRANEPACQESGKKMGAAWIQTSWSIGKSPPCREVSVKTGITGVETSTLVHLGVVRFVDNKVSAQVFLTEEGMIIR